jgi:hypothetical protein
VAFFPPIMKQQEQGQDKWKEEKAWSHQCGTSHYNSYDKP